jgi:hypothetical protein
MDKGFIFITVLFASACSTDPASQAEPNPPISADLDTNDLATEDQAPPSEDMPSNSMDMAVDPVDMAGSSGLTLNPPGWVLRDKNGVVVRALVFPGYRQDIAVDPPVLTGSANLFGEQKAPVCVLLGWIDTANGVKAGMNIPYNLQTGRPDAACQGPSELYFTQPGCNGTPISTRAPYLHSFNGSLWITEGNSSQKAVPSRLESRQYYGGCEEITDGLRHFPESRYPGGPYKWTLKPLPAEYADRLPNPPYSLSVE